MTSSTEPLITLSSAKPYAYAFPPSRTALVLIDVQRDFVEPGGFGAIQCGDPAVFATVRSVVPAAQRALAAARSLGLHIVHTREGHSPDLADLSAAKRDRQLLAPGGHHTLGIGEKGPMGRLLVRGERGHETVDELRPRPGEVVVDKAGKGSFWDTDLHRKLMSRGVTHLIFCGVTTECCVTTTAREASDRGFEGCILGDDCTGGFDEEFVRASLAMFSSYDGLFGFVAESAELVAEAGKLGPLPTSPDPPLASDERSLDIETLERLYRQRALTPVDVLQSVYTRAEDYEHENPYVWIHLRPRADVIRDAEALVEKYAHVRREELPALYGVPFAAKDNFDVAGIPTTAACPAYAYVPQASSPVVTALLDAGAILVGKTNMDQLATGLSGRRSPYGNPASVFGGGKYVPGGSSSGSGVAVAARLVSFSLGTDTGGSGRVPAALNGIVGYKPTKGTLSATGIVPACRSLDTASVFALSVGDARKVWYVVDGLDPRDPYAKETASLPVTLADYRGLRRAGFTFAVPPPAALELCSEAFRAAFTSAVDKVRSIGGRLKKLDDAAYQPFLTATKLLYDGALVYERIACIGSEFVISNQKDLHPVIRELFSKALSKEVKPWNVFEDQFRQAEAVRQVAQLMSRQHGGGGIDVLLVPTTPFHPTVVEMEAEPITLNARLGQFTNFGNVLDLCAISVNAGYVDGGMPFGVSFVCAKGMDGYAFDVASEFEAAVSKT